MDALSCDNGTETGQAQPGLSVGIGLTSDCDLSCAHCYRDPTNVSRVTLEQIKVICDNLPVASWLDGPVRKRQSPRWSWPRLSHVHRRRMVTVRGVQTRTHRRMWWPKSQTMRTQANR